MLVLVGDERPIPEVVEAADPIGRAGLVGHWETQHSSGATKHIVLGPDVAVDFVRPILLAVVDVRTLVVTHVSAGDGKHVTLGRSGEPAEGSGFRLDSLLCLDEVSHLVVGLSEAPHLGGPNGKSHMLRSFDHSTRGKVACDRPHRVRIPLRRGNFPTPFEQTTNLGRALADEWLGQDQSTIDRLSKRRILRAFSQLLRDARHSFVHFLGVDIGAASPGCDSLGETLERDQHRAKLAPKPFIGERRALDLAGRLTVERNKLPHQGMLAHELPQTAKRQESEFHKIVTKRLPFVTGARHARDRRGGATAPAASIDDLTPTLLANLRSSPVYTGIPSAMPPLQTLPM